MPCDGDSVCPRISLERFNFGIANANISPQFGGMQVGVVIDTPRDEFPVRLDIRAWVACESGSWVARIPGLPDLVANDTTPAGAVAKIQGMAQRYFLESPRTLESPTGRASKKK